METQDLKEDTKDLLAHAGDYADTFYKLSLLKITKRTADAASVTVFSVVASLFLVFILLFTGFGAAWWLGDVLNNRVQGFLLVAVFYMVLLLLVIALRKKIMKPFKDFLVRKMYEQD